MRQPSVSRYDSSSPPPLQPSPAACCLAQKHHPPSRRAIVAIFEDATGLHSVPSSLQKASRTVTCTIARRLSLALLNRPFSTRCDAFSHHGTERRACDAQVCIIPSSDISTLPLSGSFSTVDQGWLPLYSVSPRFPLPAAPSSFSVPSFLSLCDAFFPILSFHCQLWPENYWHCGALGPYTRTCIGVPDPPTPLSKNRRHTWLPMSAFYRLALTFFSFR